MQSSSPAAPPRPRPASRPRCGARLMPAAAGQARRLPAGSALHCCWPWRCCGEHAMPLAPLPQGVSGAARGAGGRAGAHHCAGRALGGALPGQPGCSCEAAAGGLEAALLRFSPAGLHCVAHLPPGGVVLVASKRPAALAPACTAHAGRTSPCSCHARPRPHVPAPPAACRLLRLCCAQIVRPTAFDSFRNFVKWRDTVTSVVWLVLSQVRFSRCAPAAAGIPVPLRAGWGRRAWLAWGGAARGCDVYDGCSPWQALAQMWRFRRLRGARKRRCNALHMRGHQTADIPHLRAPPRRLGTRGCRRRAAPWRGRPLPMPPHARCWPGGDGMVGGRVGAPAAPLPHTRLLLRLSPTHAAATSVRFGAGSRAACGGWTCGRQTNMMKQNTARRPRASLRQRSSWHGTARRVGRRAGQRRVSAARRAPRGPLVAALHAGAVPPLLPPVRHAAPPNPAL